MPETLTYWLNRCSRADHQTSQQRQIGPSFKHGCSSVKSDCLRRICVIKTGVSRNSLCRGCLGSIDWRRTMPFSATLECRAVMSKVKMTPRSRWPQGQDDPKVKMTPRPRWPQSQNDPKRQVDTKVKMTDHILHIVMNHNYFVVFCKPFITTLIILDADLDKLDTILDQIRHSCE